jgi:hypothetical protein
VVTSISDPIDVPTDDKDVEVVDELDGDGDDGVELSDAIEMLVTNVVALSGSSFVFVGMVVLTVDTGVIRLVIVIFGCWLNNI